VSGVRFRYRASKRTGRVELRADLTHWNDPIAMRPEGDGWWQTERALPPGVYEYKFRLGEHQWLLDPRNRRTRARAGSRNSVVVVDGTDEPVLHAPAPPFLFGEDDGRVCIRAGLRHGAGDSLAIAWDDGAGFRERAMTAIAREAEHTIYQAHLPGCGRRIDYLFVTDAGVSGAPGGAGRQFFVDVATLASPCPAWWPDAIVYTIFVDRFRRGGSDGVWPEPARTDRDYCAGGDLDGIREVLPRLRDLGVTALHLTPICTAPSPHRYDAAAPRSVDPALGGQPALARLLDAAHALDLRVLVDVTVIHVHRDFFAFVDVQQHGAASPYWEWFYIHAHPFGEGPRPGYRHYQKGQWQEPLLRLDNPEVAEYVVGTFEHWIRAGADGVRVDAAADVPVPLLGRIGAAVHRLNRDAVVFGEVVPANLHRFTGAGLHAATDFAMSHAVRDWLCGDSDAAALETIRRQREVDRGGPSWSRLRFTSTHDQPRLASASGDIRRARLGQLLVLMSAGVPMLYYGDELGLKSDVRTCDFEDAWADRQCMPWDLHAWDCDTQALVWKAIDLRRRRAAIRRGSEEPLPVAPDHLDVFGFRRRAGEQVIDVLVNRGDEPVSVDIGTEPAVLLLAQGTVDVTAGRVGLPGYGAVVLDRSPPHDIELCDHNASLMREAHRRRLVDCPAQPPRLYLTVTEHCNLRCAHCITSAPALTRSRKARSLRPWLIDALAPSFAAADYFGFVHGGESLASPMFEPVLAAIARALASRTGRHQVHLATNGMLLSAARAQRLVDAGLSSVMVSVDGASAAINNRIRVGSNFDRIVANVRSLVALRERAGYDVRVGISSVLTASNADQAGALAHLAADLGVDWLKLEETYPATEFARLELVPADDARIKNAVAAAADALAGSGVVLVDHTDPPTGCVCNGGSAGLRAFRAADNFANRFDYCACRAPWEQACIDPDGVVHQVDYGYPALGTLLDTPMVSLWNSDTARRIRQLALAA